MQPTHAVRVMAGETRVALLFSYNIVRTTLLRDRVLGLHNEAQRLKTDFFTISF